MVESDKIAFVKRNFGIELKAYSLKKKRLLNKINSVNYWSINDLISSGNLPDLSASGLPFPAGLKKLI